MIVIDSSLWLEYFIDSEYSVIIENLLDYPEKIIVPTISLTEIYKKILIEWNKSIADEFILHFQAYNIVDLTFSLSILAANISREFKLPLADSIIYTTALDNQATLYTMDKHFKDLSNVNYYEKKSS